MLSMLSTLTIVGVGLIGGSLGMAARVRNLAQRVTGVGRHPESLAQAQQLGAIDEFTTDLAAGLKDAELVIVCAPVEAIAPLVNQIAASAPSGALITDVGSTKEKLVERIEADLQSRKAWVEFIGSHPMAGSDKAGSQFARSDLFVQRAAIVTPTNNSRPESIAKSRRFGKRWDPTSSPCPPAEHDQAVATISHVPHLVASALAAGTPRESLPLVAGGWLDCTRVAAGDPELWRQILTQNRVHVLKQLAEFGTVLSALRDALQAEDDVKLLKLLAAGKNIRDTVGSRHSASPGTT